MLPIVDYGGIAIVVSKVAAVGSIVRENDSWGFEIYLSGIAHPLAVFIGKMEEAEQRREELVAVIALYYRENDCGYDFEEEEYEGSPDDESDDIDKEGTH